MKKISYDNFKKMDIRLGTIEEIDEVLETDKLLFCKIDFGEKDEDGNKKLEQIVSGIKEYNPDYKKLIGKQTLYIINLEPREICGVESNGMLLAASLGEEKKPIFLISENEVENGSKIG